MISLFKWIKRKLKGFIFGTCPICGSEQLVHIEGWGRTECQVCHYYWTVF